MVSKRAEVWHSVSDDVTTWAHACRQHAMCAFWALQECSLFMSDGKNFPTIVQSWQAHRSFACGTCFILPSYDVYREYREQL